VLDRTCRKFHTRPFPYSTELIYQCQALFISSSSMRKIFEVTRKGPHPLQTLIRQALTRRRSGAANADCLMKPPITRKTTAKALSSCKKQRPLTRPWKTASSRASPPPHP